MIKRLEIGLLRAGGFDSVREIVDDDNNDFNFFLFCRNLIVACISYKIFEKSKIGSYF